LTTRTYNVVGHATGRSEGPDKVTGQGKYGLDMSLPGQLWCKLLRSPFAHARIVRIDVSAALALEGVHSVLTGKDVEGMRTARGSWKDEPVLCWDEVMFAGDKVAAVVADDEDIAQRAVDLIEVEYEEFEPILSAEEAAKPDARILHPGLNDYTGVKPQETPSNVLVQLHRDRGDIAKGFAEADVIVEKSYWTPWQHQAYLEPHASLVQIDDDGRLQVWVSCQLPTPNRDELIRITGLEPDKVVFNSTYIGGSFGGKTDTTAVYISYLFAQKTGRPVKFTMDYSEELQAMNPRHPSSIRVKAGVKRDGTITAWQAEGYMAVGAYAAYAPIPNGLRGVLEVGGPYRVANVSLDIFHCYTNTVPCGFARAPGMPQGLWAGESHMDVTARAIGMDPFEFRVKNVIGPGEELMNGSTFDAMRVEETLTGAAREAAYQSGKPANVGRGIGIGHHSQGGGEAHAVVTVEPDGEIRAEFSTFDTGGGTFTVMAQVVAEQLGVEASRIETGPFPTSDLGPMNGVGGSRGARVTTSVGHEAGVDTREKLQRLAAEFLGWTEERIVFRNGFAENEANGERIKIEEIAARSGGPVIGKGDVAEAASPYTSFGTQIAEVAVDPDTGQVEILKFTAVHETGRILNPTAFYGQVEGGIIYGIGETLMTETAYDESGRVTNPSLADMKLPNIQDIPELNTVILESDVGDGPYKVRGIGEHTNIMTAPAIANAIEDAVGVRITDLPITSEKILNALRLKNES
jgi:xanthine dehydrogenase molybdenum-binding subunit